MKEIGKVVIDGETLRIMQGKYEDNESTAIVLLTEEGLHYGTLSVNLMESDMFPPGVFAVKTWAENARMIEPMRNTGLFGTQPFEFKVGPYDAVAEVWNLKNMEVDDELQGG